MASLRVRVLGTPEIRCADQVLKIPTRKAMALLIFLMAEGGAHTRARLTSLFWPDSTSANGRAALRVTLAQLRAILNVESGLADALLVDRDTLGFQHTANVDFDLAVVQRAFAQVDARFDPSPGGCSDLRQNVASLLRAAVDIYHGDFLENFALSDAPEFDAWASVQREACQRQMDAVYERLSGLYAAGGDQAHAEEIAELWCHHHPLNEAAHRALMQARFAGEDFAGALRAYDACCQVLRRELDIAPAPDTVALGERIRMGTPRRRPAEAPRMEKPPSAAMLLEAPLVGRAAEFGELVRAYAMAGQGHSQVVILKGEAGAGKTRLAHEFVRWAAAQDADVLESQAHETGGHLPYQALVDALRKRMALANAPEDLLPDVWLAELSLLLPELRERYPDLPLPLSDESTARTRLFEAIAMLGQVLAAHAPVALFIDDIQWADEASLDVLTYAVRRWQAQATRILVLLSVRLESLAGERRLSEWLADVGKTAPLTQLALGPLNVEDILQFVQALSADAVGSADSGAPAPDLQRFSQWLHAETNGQPFYIVETLKALLERDVLTLKLHGDGRWLFDFGQTNDVLALRNIIPMGVREVVRTRLNHLNPTAQMLVAAAAVLGHGFRFSTLCRVANLDEDAGLTALEQTLVNRLLRELTKPAQEAGEISYSFAHDKIREVVYAELSAARKTVYHRRAFEALQADQADPALLAQHALAAGLPEPAFRYSLLAGDKAMAVFAVTDAIRYYEQARQGADHLGITKSATDLYNLYAELGRAYELSNRFKQARSIYEEMLTVGRQANHAKMMVVALSRLATLSAQISSDYQAAAALQQQALGLAEAGDDRALTAETEWGLAQVMFHAWLPSQGLPHAERALALARQLNDTGLTARSLNVVALLTLSLGEWERTKACAAEAAALYAGTGNRAMEADSLGHLANAQLMCCDFQSALDTARRMQQISVDIGNVWSIAMSHFTQAATCRDIGQYAAALEHARAAAEYVRTIDVPILSFMIHSVLGALYRALLRLEDARAEHEKILPIAERLGASCMEQTAAELCAVHALAGEWDAAGRYARQALAARNFTFMPGMGLPRPYETEALLRVGDGTAALQDLERFEQQTPPAPRFRVSYLRCMAVVAHWRGDYEQEIRQLKSASELAQTLGLPGEQWLILASLGDGYERIGAQIEARSVRVLAVEIIHSLAARIGDEQLRDEFLAAQAAQRLLHLPS